MTVKMKIASLNLCLGLRNKKEAVKKLITENDIQIMCLQETEISVDFPADLLTFKGYNFENENNEYKKDVESMYLIKFLTCDVMISKL